jgi:hypothetical protein
MAVRGGNFSQVVEVVMSWGCEVDGVDKAPCEDNAPNRKSIPSWNNGGTLFSKRYLNPKPQGDLEK